LYHVISRGNERRAIVRDDADRKRWLKLLDQVVRRRGWQVLAWVLMDNHFHLYLRTPQPDLSAGMHDLNAGYATLFNRRHSRCGPLLQGRFKAVLVEQESHDWELTRYIHLNPVRAGLAGRPEVYPWSSCSAYLNPRIAPEWLIWQEVLTSHGRGINSARRAYLAFLNEGVFHPPTCPLSATVGSALLGSPAFIERMQTLLTGRPADPEIPQAKRLRRQPSLQEISREVCQLLGSDPEILMRRGRQNNEARSTAIYLARMLTTTPVAQIGQHFGGIRSAAVSHIVHAVADRRTKDRRLASRLCELEKQLNEN